MPPGTQGNAPSFLERGGVLCYTSGTFHLLRGDCYGDGTGQRSQDEKEAPEECQAGEGTGESTAWGEEG